MTPRRGKVRIYSRTRGGVSRYYGDFRSWSDVGGRQEPLVAAGEKLATSDPVVAQALATGRVRELDAMRHDRALHGRRGRATLADFAARHLVKKKQAGRVTVGWLELSETFLGRAIEYFGRDRALDAIAVEHVEAWAVHLAGLTTRGGRPLSPGTVRHHLNVLSGLYRRARAEQLVPSGYDPVGDMLEKPIAHRREAHFLEVSDAALLLEAARTLPPRGSELRAEYVLPLVATFLLTGGRRAEVLGLEIDDVSFTRATVTFRENAFRPRFKTALSARVVPLWPQLSELLRDYLNARTAGIVLHDAPASTLLFPSFRSGSENRLVDIRKTIDRVAIRAGWKAGEIRSRAFRHTYCSARLATLDRGHPVSPFQVARELGHGGDSLVKRIYGHVGEIRHRAEVVEYRIEQHAEVLADRLGALLRTSLP